MTHSRLQCNYFHMDEITNTSIHSQNGKNQLHNNQEKDKFQ